MVGLIAAAGCVVRTWRASDDWEMSSWNPSKRTFTERRLTLRRGGFVLHSESTAALPGDNVAPLVALVAPTNRRVVHRVWPAGPARGGPWLWGSLSQHAARGDQCFGVVGLLDAAVKAGDDADSVRGRPGGMGDHGVAAVARKTYRWGQGVWRGCAGSWGDAAGFVGIASTGSKDRCAGSLRRRVIRPVS